MRRSLPILALLLAALVGGTTSPAARAQDASSTPVLRVSDGDLVFNDVALGASRTKALTITNAGGGTLPLTKLAVGGGDSADFGVAPTCDGAQLTTGQSCTVNVTFSPKAPSTRVTHVVVPTSIQDCTVYVTAAGTGATATTADHAERHSGFSTTCGGAPAAGTTTTTTVVVNPTSGVLGTSDAGSAVCQSRRALRIHWRAPKGRTFKRGTFTVKTKGRTFEPKFISKGKRRGQYSADLSFKGLKVGRYAVRINGKLTNGKSFKRTRHFVTCISGKTP